MERENEFRVLYIEDNPLDVEFVSKSVEGIEPFRVEAVNSFEAGMKRLESGEFDVLLLDLNLPDAPGGLETFSRARAAHPSVPIVVFTSMDDEQLGQDAVKRGAHDYLVKRHVNGFVLLNTLRFAVERQQEEGFFRTMVFSNSKPVVVTDWKGTLKFVNPAAEKLFGRKAEDWVGRMFGYPFDPDRPGIVEIASGEGRTRKIELSVVETEMSGEVFNIIHFKDGNP